MEDHNDLGSNVNQSQQYVGNVPRWSFFIAIFIIGGLLSVLSERITIGPSWLIPVITLVLLIPMLISIKKSHQKMTRVIALIITGMVTIGLISSVGFLVYGLFTHTNESAMNLLMDAAILWVTNVSVFGAWYWEIDQGGPYLRHVSKTQPIDFLYPQMMFESDLWANWKPTLLDYLFLAFNTSAALGPTDTLVLSRRAKLLMNTQSSISLIIVAVLAAHAIGAL
ncbi:DUF1345 domain-containing protein [Paenibacillus aestuarii]|uniref:DUF1345 domain-containing protein n=1 Tax=Paenibacillus aestuarii TaxID=516965 RepID=A0ABW0KHQ7_9BACL|nr:DUF1345 domain-containing protein [Paenibacillus aestuarii]